MFFVLLAITLLSASILFTAVKFTKEEIQRGNIETLESLTSDIVENVEKEFAAHKKIAQAISMYYTLCGNILTREQYMEFSKKLITLNKNTLGSGIWIEPYKYKSTEKYFGPYVYKDGDDILYSTEYETDDYDYPTTDWYLSGKSKKDVAGEVLAAGWTNPYYDETTGITMITMAVPIIKNGEFLGTVSADYDLGVIQNFISEMTVKASGDIMLVDNTGLIISATNQELVMKQNANEYNSFKELIKNYDATKMNVVKTQINGKDYEVYAKSIPETGWKVLVNIPEKELYQNMRDMVQKIIYTVIIATLIALALLYLIIRIYIQRPIRELVKEMEILSVGDLTFTTPKKLIKKKDEVGILAKAVDKIKENFKVLASDMSKSSEQLNSASKEMIEKSTSISTISSNISDAILGLADGATNQANDTQLGLKNMMEFGKLINDNVELINQVAQMSEKVDGVVKDGVMGIERLTNASNKNSEIISEVHKVIIETEENSKKINSASNLIANIADQTNLLAVNATIEAARAGEAGKGFAVVAKEISKLADESASSADTISTIVSALAKHSGYAVKKMQEAEDMVGEQLSEVEAVKKNYAVISDEMIKANQGTTKLSQQAGMINESKETVIHVIENLSAIAEENAASTEEMSASIQEQSSSIQTIAEKTTQLAAISDALNTEVKKFKF